MNNTQYVSLKAQKELLIAKTQSIRENLESKIEEPIYVMTIELEQGKNGIQNLVLKKFVQAININTFLTNLVCRWLIGMMNFPISLKIKLIFL